MIKKSKKLLFITLTTTTLLIGCNNKEYIKSCKPGQTLVLDRAGGGIIRCDPPLKLLGANSLLADELIAKRFGVPLHVFLREERIIKIYSDHEVRNGRKGLIPLMIWLGAIDARMLPSTYLFYRYGLK